MKANRAHLLLLILIFISSPIFAAEKSTENWDNLIEISHTFTWYPHKDFNELVKVKSDEYHQSLEEYQNILLSELTEGETAEGSINPELFKPGKPWKLYYRLALAQFCSFLAEDDARYLENAMAVISVISDKKEIANVSFWYYLFQSYDDLIKKDSEGFIESVFQLWNNAILQAEMNQAIIQSSLYQSGNIPDIYYFYENAAHLIIRKAIIENRLANLPPLSTIVIGLKERLSLDNGYKTFVEAIVERLEGLKSDNNNLNFAVAFVEATANQYDFEDEKSKHAIVEKYNTARLSYELALSWANTNKGKAAILTQYIGFNSYIVRRLVEKDPLLTSNSLFSGIPNEATTLADTSVALFDELSKSSTRKDAFLRDGFGNMKNYLAAMHQLWDSSTKLLMVLASYHKTTQQEGTPGLAEAFYLKYLTFFDQHAQKDVKILPDNAVYMAAYASSQLSALYAEAAPYSTGMQYHDLSFAYQLRAVEMFPLDIIGLLKLSHQADQELRPRIYFEFVAPLSTRLRDSKVVESWLKNSSKECQDIVSISFTVFPDIIENAFLYLKILQESQDLQTEEDIYNKLLIMNAVYTSLKAQHLDEQISSALILVGKLKFSDDDMPLGEYFKQALPPTIRDTVMVPPELEIKFSIGDLRKKLYASPDFRIHSFLRELYFEQPVRTRSLNGTPKPAK